MAPRLSVNPPCQVKPVNKAVKRQEKKIARELEKLEKNLMEKDSENEKGKQQSPINWKIRRRGRSWRRSRRRRRGNQQKESLGNTRVAKLQDANIGRASTKSTLSVCVSWIECNFLHVAYSN